MDALLFGGPSFQKVLLTPTLSTRSAEQNEADSISLLRRLWDLFQLVASGANVSRRANAKNCINRYRSMLAASIFFTCATNESLAQCNCFKLLSFDSNCRRIGCGA